MVPETCHDGVTGTVKRSGGLYAPRTAASLRALELLVEHLTPEQREDWRRDQRFVCIGSVTGDPYVICVGRHWNIQNLNTRRQYCIILQTPLDGQVPIGDQLLGTKLIIESAEDMLYAMTRYNGRIGPETYPSLPYPPVD